MWKTAKCGTEINMNLANSCKLVHMKQSKKVNTIPDLPIPPTMLNQWVGTKSNSTQERIVEREICEYLGVNTISQAKEPRKAASV